MAYPVSERIAIVVLKRLERLQVSGYGQVDFNSVVRPTRQGGYTPQHRQIVLTQQPPARVPELDCPGNPPAEANDLRFTMQCHAMPSERDPRALDELLNYMAADARYAVTDATNWHTFGGLAINARFEDTEMIPPSGSFAAVYVPLVVTYRTDETNPYTVRA